HLQASPLELGNREPEPLSALDARRVLRGGRDPVSGAGKTGMARRSVAWGGDAITLVSRCGRGDQGREQRSMTPYTTALRNFSSRPGTSDDTKRMSHPKGISHRRRRPSSMSDLVDPGAQPCGRKNSSPSDGANLWSAPAARSFSPHKRRCLARMSGATVSRSHEPLGKWR